MDVNSVITSDKSEKIRSMKSIYALHHIIQIPVV